MIDVVGEDGQTIQVDPAWADPRCRRGCYGSGFYGTLIDMAKGKPTGRLARLVCSCVTDAARRRAAEVQP